MNILQKFKFKFTSCSVPSGGMETIKMGSEREGQGQSRHDQSPPFSLQEHEEKQKKGKKERREDILSQYLSQSYS